MSFSALIQIHNWFLRLIFEFFVLTVLYVVPTKEDEISTRHFSRLYSQIDLLSLLGYYQLESFDQYVH